MKTVSVDESLMLVSFLSLSLATKKLAFATLHMGTRNAKGKKIISVRQRQDSNLCSQREKHVIHDSSASP